MKYQIYDLLGIVLNAYGMCINYLNDWLTCNYSETRMHSSRMRTVRNSSRLLLGGLHTPPREQAPWEQAPPGAGTPQEQAPPPRAGTPPEQTPQEQAPLSAARHAGIPPAMHSGIEPPL